MNSGLVCRRLATAALLAGTVGLGVGVIAPAGIAHAYVGRCAGEATPGGHPRRAGVLPTGCKRWRSLHRRGHGGHAPERRPEIRRPLGDEVIFRLWGDDPESDDLLSEFRPDAYFATPEGLGMRGATTISESAVDEDSFPDPAYADEWYTGIRLTDIRNGVEHKVETCRLTNEF